MLTEQQNPKTHNLDQLSTLEILQTMNAEDALVVTAVQRALPDVARAVDAIAERKAKGGRVFYVGAGTSGRLGVLDAVECVPTFGTDPNEIQGIIAGGLDAMTRAVEGAEDNEAQARADLAERSLGAHDVVVGIAASGTTPYVLSAIAYAQTLGCLTVGIACNAPSPLLERAELPIAVVVGAEVLTGSTRLKAGTAQKLVLNMLSTALMVRMGKVYGNLMVDVQITNQKLADRAERIVMQVGAVNRDVARELLRMAGGSAKVAIVMARLGYDAHQARETLRSHKGNLRAVIGS
jgi:N-acetylmuramic acid 6-phosphate etherase